jgi:hypothetical protein
MPEDREPTSPAGMFGDFAPALVGFTLNRPAKGDVR